MSDWGVWCRRGDDLEYGWFRHSDGTPIHYYTESEARSIASGLKLLLPQNEYEARPMPEFDTEGAANADKLREALKSVPTVPRSLTHVQALALIAAKHYIEALEEELGHQGVSPPEGEALRKLWIEAAGMVTLACEREVPPA